jgi:hypothetical protein
MKDGNEIGNKLHREIDARRTTSRPATDGARSMWQIILTEHFDSVSQVFAGNEYEFSQL